MIQMQDIITHFFLSSANIFRSSALITLGNRQYLSFFPGRSEMKGKLFLFKSVLRNDLMHRNIRGGREWHFRLD